MRSAVLLTVLALALLAPMVQAQSLVASVDLQCEERTEIEVAPWSTPVHPTSAPSPMNPCIRKIDISVQSNGLVVAHPGSITLNAGAEESFTVSVQADTGMSAQSRQNAVQVQVVEINGVPPPNIASADSTVIVDILQYGQAEVEGDMTVFRAMKGLSVVEAEAILTNSGNDVDDICTDAKVRSWTWEAANQKHGNRRVLSSGRIWNGRTGLKSIPDVGRQGDERIVLDVTAWSRYACDVAMEGFNGNRPPASPSLL